MAKKASRNDRRKQLTVPTNGAGRPVEKPHVEFHQAANANNVASEDSLKTRTRTVTARTEGQKLAVAGMKSADASVLLGPAGTGKTYLAVAYGIELLLARKVSRIVLSRPAVEAGENLGFLPGDLKEKIDPYLRPLYDAMHDMLSAEQISLRMENGEIEIAPLAFMRGRTLEKNFIILDEAQNTTVPQMKMFLTRLGKDSIMVITGDPSQTDLPSNVESGLTYAIEALKDVKGIKFVTMTSNDVVRHELVADFVNAFDKYDNERAKDEPAIRKHAAKRAQPRVP